MSDHLSTRAARLLEIQQRAETRAHVSSEEVDWLLAELTAAEAERDAERRDRKAAKKRMWDLGHQADAWQSRAEAAEARVARGGDHARDTAKLLRDAAAALAEAGAQTPAEKPSCCGRPAVLSGDGKRWLCAASADTIGLVAVHEAEK